GFAKSRTPRVYMTYTGGASDVITLAHELGHAYHTWVMRDLPDCQRRYGMSLAETASTFGETIVRDALVQRAAMPAEEFSVVWEEASALIAFILNIPARFDFERDFCEARAERPLRPVELNELMRAAWEKWYGDSLSEPDPLFWASKLHFYISGLSFYNFPYLFGYLFSLGVYARRAEFGDEFFPRYEALLRDTGRMTAEDLAAKHLEADLTRPDFWRATVAMLEPRIDRFEELVDQMVPG
ncbi:MAG: M3 family metallopeptidase, partial [Immundisolibacterales bacterium]|nr:M3 family metallopeptidase [Immundisolibacterales bacterium]